ncbi:MAG: hypothetical protein A3J38_03020 [Gammaproteobacteria bacterium RIFCSPHIGHO2_12_FULL_45_9]|nr:MAG: hypothetical protein A3J38_03020 [Gammaproteobacteria bacterium RIFCSPHIGHO2_12_FULL_45_9]
MFRVPEAYRKPLWIAIALHIGLIIGLLLKPTSVSYRTDIPTTIVHATVVSSTALRAMTPVVHQAPASMPKPSVQAAAMAPPPKAAVSVQAPTIAVPTESPDAKLLAAQAEKMKTDAMRRQKEAEARKIALQKAALQKKMEAMRVAELQKEQQQLQQKMLEKELAQEEKKLQQQQLAEARTQAAQKAAESRAQAAANQGVLDRYRAAILQVIGHNWHPPQQTDLSCQLEVRVGPGGVVLSVNLLQSSGDPALDQSAEVAVMKASPLPVPEDAALFDEFRTLHIRMSPQEIT